MLQFHLLFLNWCWHSRIAWSAPDLTLSIISTFFRQIFLCLFTSPTKESQVSGICIVERLDILARDLEKLCNNIFKKGAFENDQAYYSTKKSSSIKYMPFGNLCIGNTHVYCLTFNTWTPIHWNLSGSRFETCFKRVELL